MIQVFPVIFVSMFLPVPLMLEFRDGAGELVPATGMQKEQRGQRTVSCIPGRGRMFPHSGQKLGSPPKHDISVTGQGASCCTLGEDRLMEILNGTVTVHTIYTSCWVVFFLQCRPSLT